MANGKNVYIPVFKDSVKATCNKPGRAHTTVSMKINGENKYGELFFKESDVFPGKSKNQMNLRLRSDSMYHVGFSDGYVQMSGQEIADANRAYIKERQDANQIYKDKFQAGVGKAKQDDAAGKIDFHDENGNAYTREELIEFERNSPDTFDLATGVYDDDGYDVAMMNIDVTCSILSNEMGNYFSDMTPDERRKLVTSLDKSSRNWRMEEDKHPFGITGRLGVVLSVYRNMIGHGFSPDWKDTSKDFETVKTAEITKQQDEFKNQHESLEASYSVNRDGKLVTKGVWQQSDGTYKNITFKASYGSHEFTEDECKKLLAGNEVTIKDFMTKSGNVIDITGKLAEQKYMGHTYVGFARTDLQKSKSRPLPSVADSLDSPQDDVQFEG